MNHQQAQEFIHKALKIWEKGEVTLLEKIYNPKVIAHYQGKTFGLLEIKNRMLYINERYPERKFYLGEMVLLEPQLILFRVRQTSMDKLYKKPSSIDVTAVYKIKNNLIQELWLFTDIPLDYYAKLQPKETKFQKEKTTIDEIEKKQFAEKLQDYSYFYQGKKVILTERERECLYYFLNGYTAKEIAKILHLKYRTVEGYLAKIKEKYGCSSKQELRQKIFPAGPWL